MKMLIIEGCYPEDFFLGRLDGPATHHLANILRISSRLVYVLDREHLYKSIKLAATKEADILHLSCHGAEDGIVVTDNKQIGWPEFVKIFDDNNYSPKALVMSTCYGAATGLGKEFKRSKARPEIIFGSTDERSFNEYAVAWAILYNAFSSNGVNRDVAREALRSICAVVSGSFRYLRWDDTLQDYRKYPADNRTFSITEVDADH